MASTIHAANFNGSLDVINAATLQTSASIPAGVEPNGIAISPDGTEPSITDAVSTSITVIDLTTNQVSGTIPVGTSSSAVAYIN